MSRFHPVRRAHFLCCSVLTALSSHTAQLGLYVPSCTPCRSCLPPYRPPYTVQTRKPTESPPRPPSYGTTNTVYLATTLVTMLSIGRLEWSSLAPAPHRRSRVSRSLSSISTSTFASRCACFLGFAPSPSPSPGPACAPLHSMLRQLGRMNTSWQSRFAIQR